MMKKLREKKGFTLAELLIVVAIIAILVAVSIPIFTTQLEKSRESTDLANLRAAKAAGVAAVLDQDAEGLCNIQGSFIDVEDNTIYYDTVLGSLTTEEPVPTQGKGTAADGGTGDTYEDAFDYTADTVAQGLNIVVDFDLDADNNNIVRAHFA